MIGSLLKTPLALAATALLSLTPAVAGEPPKKSKAGAGGVISYGEPQFQGADDALAKLRDGRGKISTHNGLERVTIRGSSTVGPFALAVREVLREQIELEVEETGSSRGLADVCALKGERPDIAAASRRISEVELARCAKIGVRELVEIPIGRDGVVLAQSKKAKGMSLTAKDLYLALAARTPINDQTCVMEKNERSTWRDVRPDLPNREILVLGPARGSGTLDVFMSSVMKRGALAIPCLATYAETSPDWFERSMRLRRGTYWTDAGEHDGAIVLTLTRVPKAIGVFGFGFLLQHEDLEAVAFEGVVPSRETIAAASYTLSRPLFLYVRGNTLAKNDRVQKVVDQFTHFSSTGPAGYLTRKGLVTSGERPEPMILHTDEIIPRREMKALVLVEEGGQGADADEHSGAKDKKASHGNGH